MRARGVVFAWLAALALPVAAGAQQAQCDVVEKPSNRVLSYQLPSGERNSFVGGGGITMRCPSRGIVLLADSIESYGDERRVFLIGNVRYTEPRIRVTADNVTYLTMEDRILASGSVVATLPSGSTMRGPQAEYRRAAPRIRPEAELQAVGRPTVTIVQQPSNAPRDTAGGTPPPTEVTANTLLMRADTLLYGSGQVDIVRPDFGASADSVFMNTESQYMRLMRSPAITGKKGRAFRLTGRLIDVFSERKRLDRVIAQGSARAVSEDLTLTADTIAFAVREDLLQAAHAWGGATRAVAVSPAQRVEADSIAVEMPGQRIDRMMAFGTAYAESDPDSVRFVTDEKDWLRGDTIRARFDTAAAAPGDTSRVRIRQLVAVGGARSYYHLAPSDSAERRPAINYVRGDSIDVAFDSGRVATVRVLMRDGAVPTGLFVEPVDSATAARARPGSAPSPAGSAPRTPLLGRRPAPGRDPAVVRPAADSARATSNPVSRAVPPRPRSPS